MARHMSDSHTVIDEGDRTDGDGRRQRPTRDASERRADDERRDPAPAPPHREPRYSDGDLLHGR
jgi:hypothetical protein